MSTINSTNNNAGNAIGIAQLTDTLMALRNNNAGTLTVQNIVDLLFSLSTTNAVIKYTGSQLVTSSTVLIDSGDRLTNSSQTLMTSVLSGNVNNVTGDGTSYQIVFNANKINQGNALNVLTGVFTAPVAGNYKIQGSIGINGLTASHTAGFIQIVSTQGTYTTQAANYGAMRDVNNNLAIPFCIGAIPMAANDTVYITIDISGGTKVCGILDGNNTFVTFSLLPA